MTVKQKLVARAKELGLETDKLTIAQLKEAIAEAEAAQADPAAGQPADAGEEPSTVTEPAADPKPDAGAEPVEAEPSQEEVQFAKAGKRSRKSVLEAEEEAARQAKKEDPAESAARPEESCPAHQASKRTTP